MRLSILDFQTPAGAIELVQAADALGFHRFWIGEHHSQYQCANPLLLATVLAGLTRRIRLGTGGVCLSYANPFRVAEDARLAHYLFPDRLDLGVARGLGYQPALLAALAGAEGAGRPDSFAARATALHQYVTGRLPSGPPAHWRASPPRAGAAGLDPGYLGGERPSRRRSGSRLLHLAASQPGSRRGAQGGRRVRGRLFAQP